MPADVERLITLRQIRDGWLKSVRQVYNAVNAGDLHTYAVPGHQRYYALSQVVKAFGEPVQPDVLKTVAVDFRGRGTATYPNPSGTRLASPHAALG